MDNGPGISPDRLQWIFEPFNSSKGSRGTGLGLSLVKHAAAALGGKVGLESVWGRGTMVWVEVPVEG